LKDTDTIGLHKKNILTEGDLEEAQLPSLSRLFNKRKEEGKKNFKVL